MIERAELYTAIEEAAEVGTVGPLEADMLLSLLDLERVKVREVMTPRVLIRAVPADTPARDLPRLFRRLRRARLPVYSTSIDTTVGFLHVNDALGLGTSPRTLTAKDVARPALFVPANLTLDRLVARFRAEGQDMAMVVDEWGSVAGLVTMHDVVEEVLGPLPDRHDPSSPAMVLNPDGSWLVPGDFPLDGLERAFGIRVGDPLVETIGGRITHVLGPIPSPGESLSLPEGLQVKVLKADARRVGAVALTPLSPRRTS